MTKGDDVFTKRGGVSMKKVIYRQREMMPFYFCLNSSFWTLLLLQVSCGTPSFFRFGLVFK
jgi:hypothetical protein